MSQPFYVSPEQLMKDRADFARKGVARGRAVVALGYADGICFVGENPSRALHKISEIYDRIAFAAVGKYNEFENLRVAGVRYADLRGYSYDRVDVTARGLANAYAQTLGSVFTQESKPYEVEVVVAEVGRTVADDQMYRLTYDGSVAEEHGFVVMGAGSDQIGTVLSAGWHEGLSLSEALSLAVGSLSAAPEVVPAANGSAARVIGAAQLEVAVLERERPRRCFRRPSLSEIRTALAEDAAGVPPEGTSADQAGPGTDAQAPPEH